jgi:hypothetical protein
MSLKFNPFTGKLQYMTDVKVLKFKAGVSTFSALPTEGNQVGDGRIANDTGHLYVWDGEEWEDQGDIIDVHWASVIDRPNSAVADIDDAVNKRHSQHTDTGTTSQTFQIQSGSSGVKLKNNSGVAEIRNSADNSYSELQASSLSLSNNSALRGINQAGNGYVEIIKVNTSDEVELINDLNIKQFLISANSGLVDFSDMSVTDASPDNTEHGYLFKIDNEGILKVSAKSDGAGGIKDKGIEVDGTLQADNFKSSDGFLGVTGSLLVTTPTGTATITYKNGLITNVV